MDHSFWADVPSVSVPIESPEKLWAELRLTSLCSGQTRIHRTCPWASNCGSLLSPEFWHMFSEQPAQEKCPTTQCFYGATNLTLISSTEDLTGCGRWICSHGRDWLRYIYLETLFSAKCHPHRADNSSRPFRTSNENPCFLESNY